MRGSSNSNNRLFFILLVNLLPGATGAKALWARQFMKPGGSPVHSGNCTGLRAQGTVLEVAWLMFCSLEAAFCGYAKTVV